MLSGELAAFLVSADGLPFGIRMFVSCRGAYFVTVSVFFVALTVVSVTPPVVRSCTSVLRLVRPGGGLVAGGEFVRARRLCVLTPLFTAAKSKKKLTFAPEYQSLRKE